MNRAEKLKDQRNSPGDEHQGIKDIKEKKDRVRSSEHQTSQLQIEAKI